MLTFGKTYGYTGGRVQSSDTSGHTAPERFGEFFISCLVGSAANISNMPTYLVLGFELPTPHGLRGFQRGTQDMTNSISIYNFNNNQVRTANIDGEPWFCLADCCAALKIKQNRDTATRLSQKGVGKTDILTAGGKQEVTFINEPNLYRLIFRSNKPQAQAFADWVYSEVLPSIRKTGGYGVPAPVDMKAVGGLVKKCCAVAVREELAKAFDDLVFRETIKSIGADKS